MYQAGDSTGASGLAETRAGSLDAQDLLFFFGDISMVRQEREYLYELFP